MTAPDARVAFLTAVLGDAGVGSGTGYSHEQMMDPAQFVPLLARALPLYVNGLKVCLLRAYLLCRLCSASLKQQATMRAWSCARSHQPRPVISAAA